MDPRSFNSSSSDDEDDQHLGISYRDALVMGRRVRPIDDRRTEEQPVNNRRPREQPTDNRRAMEQSTDNRRPRELPVEYRRPREHPVEYRRPREHPVDNRRTRVQPVDNRRIREQPVEDRRSREQPVEDSRSREHPVDNRRTREQPVEDRRSREQPVEDSRSREHPVDNRRTREQPVDNRRIREQPVEDRRSREQPVEDRWSREQPMVNRRAREQPADNRRPREQPLDNRRPREQPMHNRRAKEQYADNERAREQRKADRRDREQRMEDRRLRQYSLEDPEDDRRVREPSIEDLRMRQYPMESRPVTQKYPSENRRVREERRVRLYPPVDQRFRQLTLEDRPMREELMQDRTLREQPTEASSVREPHAQISPKADRRTRQHITETPQVMGHCLQDRPRWKHYPESRHLREQPMEHQPVWEPHARIFPKADRRQRLHTLEGQELKESPKADPGEGDSPDGDRSTLDAQLRNAWIHGRTHGDKATESSTAGYAAGAWITYDTKPIGKTMQSGEQPARTVHQFSGTKQTEKKLELVKYPLEPAVTLQSISAEQWDREILIGKSELENGVLPLIKSIDYPDAVILIEDMNFPVHLSVLQCFSEFFKKIVCSVYKFTKSFVSAEVFPLIYSWMIRHPDQSFRIFTRTNVLNLFVAARNLGIQILEEQCWVFLDDVRIFDENYAFFAMVEAGKMKLMPVVEMMFERVKRFFMILVASQDYVLLNVDDLCRLLSSSYIQINCEIEIYASAVRWLKHDWENRKKHTVKVMNCVRFGLIPPHTLVNLKQKHWNPEIFTFDEVTLRAGRGLTHSILFYGSVGEKARFLRMQFEDDRRNFSGIPRCYQTYEEFNDYLRLLQGYCLASLEVETGVHQPVPRHNRAQVMELESDESNTEDLQSDTEAGRN